VIQTIVHSNNLKDFNIYIFSKESFIEAESKREEIGGHFVFTGMTFCFLF